VWQVGVGGAGAASAKGRIMASQTGKQFMAMTRYRNLSPSGQQRGLPQPPLELPVEASCRTVALPGPEQFPSEPIVPRELIARRRSVREYEDRALSQAELAFLLWATQGVKEAVRDAATFRTVPSAGARHALETYLLVNRVEGLAGGLYRYLALRHELAELSTEVACARAVAAGCLDQAFVLRGAATFVWAAVAERMTWRYSDRGYRYLHLDAGHVCQNLYLAAESIGCGVCAIAAFDDDLLNEAIGVDGEEQFALYAASVGRKLPPKA
jgi:SagB-type dehydrogenase family enzyme